MKSYALFLTELAQKDIYDSEKFYEDQSPNLGVYFYDSLISDLDALKFYAGIHQKYFGFHRMITKRFPYAIYYEIESDLVVVHAVLHTRRDINIIHYRLSNI
jgi:plasmid stabilization system protein ParE